MCSRGKKKAAKRSVNVGRPITVTITAIVLLIQSIRAEDAPKTVGKKKKSPAGPPALLCSSLWEQNVLECSLPLFTGPFEWSLFFLVFHTEVSSGAWGQASKTAPRAGLAPINVLAHNGAWQARLWPAQLFRAQPSDCATPAQVSREGRAKFFKPNGKCCYFTPCECIAIFFVIFILRGPVLQARAALLEKERREIITKVWSFSLFCCIVSYHFYIFESYII